jgi:DNA-directed RNA polymerase subunit RPC12/RpoP
MAYIDREKFAEVICNFPAIDEDTANAVISLLHRQPTADVVEVNHGEWLEKEEVYGDVYYTCSNCNNDWTTIDGTPQDNFMNYCPNCGAKMDGERKSDG